HARVVRRALNEDNRTKIDLPADAHAAVRRRDVDRRFRRVAPRGASTTVAADAVAAQGGQRAQDEHESNLGSASSLGAGPHGRLTRRFPLGRKTWLQKETGVSF